MMGFPLLGACLPVGPDRWKTKNLQEVSLQVVKEKSHRGKEPEGNGICCYITERASLARWALKALKEGSRKEVGQRFWIGIVEAWWLASQGG